MGDPGGGFVPVSDVVGKVFVTVWPLDHWRLFRTPATFKNPALNTAAAVVGQSVPLAAGTVVLMPLLYRRRGLRIPRGSLPNELESPMDDDVRQPVGSGGER
jgi:signal peptidase I